MPSIRPPAFLVLFLALVALVGCSTPATQTPPSPPECELFVLGIAQDGGLPHFGCEKPCCAEARASGRALDPASLGVFDRAAGKLLLVEATPRVEEQVARLHRLA
jgi:pyrroloquinoline quinone biosynthesis protein B